MRADDGASGRASNWIVRVCTFVVLAAVAVFAVVLVRDALTRATVHGGPGPGGNLFLLEHAKVEWQKEHPTGLEWPTEQDLLPYLTRTTNAFDQIIRPRYGETYIINRTGAPVYARFAKTAGPFHKDQVLYADTNILKRFQIR